MDWVSDNVESNACFRTQGFHRHLGHLPGPRGAVRGLGRAMDAAFASRRRLVGVTDAEVFEPCAPWTWLPPRRTPSVQSIL